MKGKSPSVLIFGCGAIGSLYGLKLAQSGAKVSVFSRNNVDLIKRNGIKVKSSWGDDTLIPDQVISDIQQYKGIPDFILVCTKVIPEVDVVSAIKPKVGSETKIVLIQNGIDIEAPYCEAFGENEIISGLAFVCVVRDRIDCVNHIDYGRIILGNYPSGVSASTSYIVKLLNDVSVPCRSSENIVRERWKKTLWNAAFNPVSILGENYSTSFILKTKAGENLIFSMMKEVCLVAACKSIDLDISICKKMIEDTRKMVPYKTSMLVDYEQGRPLEIEAIIGNVIRIATLNKIETPVLETIYRLVVMKISNLDG
ncbi:2-dehydropantoate 2-reductase [Candidatus Marinamargulisbacteria bacterium SCGC AG-410-N11]|nr:2-dehydropantoate 2-reductase [Candidatus Marinamargulisbacteria bacterium SCGC AG-410-N11]